MLKVKNKQVIEVQDWDNLVEETYGRTYSFQQQDGCKDRGSESFTVPIENPYDYKNDTIPEVVNGREMGVSWKAWLARDPEQALSSGDTYLSLFWERNFYPSLEMVANDMHERGLIPAGEYTIDIDW